ncbi:MAG: hypothetical protein CMJ29_03425 [Phycisphaerae bacterium]|nr:hypothetical protein [Phycisphaerae bacterium]
MDLPDTLEACRTIRLSERGSTMSEFWVARNGERYGPYTQEQLVEYYQSGQVLPSDQVCRPGSQEWVIASSMSELSGVQDAASSSPPPLHNETIKDVPAVNLVGPILVTLFCCLPFGIVSIVFASQVPTKVAQNDLAGAQTAAASARNWMMWGFIIGLVFNLLGFGVYIFAGLAAVAGNGP